MKLYLVTGLWDLEIPAGNFVEQSCLYGVFSTQLQANYIASQLRESIERHGETEEITVTEITVNEPTSEYYFIMYADG